MERNLTISIDDLLKQERELQFARFDNEDAYRLGRMCADTALAEGLPVTIDIQRYGQQLFHAALPDTSVDNDEWIKRKCRVVQRFGHSSLYMGTFYKARNTTIQDSALLDPGEYAAHGGAFPIAIHNVGMVGTIAVSGLPQVEDHAFVVRMLTRHLQK